MRLTDDEIDRAVCSVTPTRSAAPAPNVLREMRAAKRREHRAVWLGRAWAWLQVGSVPAAYLALALVVAAMVRR